jgi:hypothetical protein
MMLSAALENLNSSYRQSTSNLWEVLFHCEGNVLVAVLPFCIVNCLLLALVAHCRDKQSLGFSPTGHGLLTLLVSFLVINKVNLAYERFREARAHVGNAFLHLRELNQLMLCFSSSSRCLSTTQEHQQHGQIHRWRSDGVVMIIQLLDATQIVIQDEGTAKYLAKNYKKHIKDYPTIVDPLYLGPVRTTAFVYE